MFAFASSIQKFHQMQTLNAFSIAADKELFPWESRKSRWYLGKCLKMLVQFVNGHCRSLIKTIACLSFFSKLELSVFICLLFIASSTFITLGWINFIFPNAETFDGWLSTDAEQKNKRRILVQLYLQSLETVVVRSAAVLCDNRTLVQFSPLLRPI